MCVSNGVFISTKTLKKFLDISLNCDDDDGHKRHKHAGGLPHVCTLLYLIRV